MDTTEQQARIYGTTPFNVLEQEADNVIMVINYLIEKAEKKSMRRLFQSKYDKQGCLILRDKDFEVG